VSNRVGSLIVEEVRRDEKTVVGISALAITVIALVLIVGQVEGNPEEKRDEVSIEKLVPVNDPSSPVWAAFFKQRELAMKARGFRVREIFTGSLDGKFKHGAIIWVDVSEPVAPNSLLEVFRLQTINGEMQVVKLGEVDPQEQEKVEAWRIRSTRGTPIIEALTEEEAPTSALASSCCSRSFEIYNLDKPTSEVWSGRDVNGDGLKEIVVTQYSGGNCWDCSTIRLFQVSQRRLRELPVEAAKGFVPKRLEDVDNDGVSEVLASDTTWESYGAFSHAFSPGVMAVYAWEKGRYIEASGRFPKFYQARIAELEKELRKAPNDEAYLSAAVDLLLNHIQKGEGRLGWERFQKLTRSAKFKDPEWAKEAQKIAKALKTRYKF